MKKYDIFLNAIKENDINTVKELLSQNYNLFMNNYWFVYSVLVYDNIEIIEYIINYLLDNKIYNYFMLLEDVIYSKNIEVLKIVLKKFNDINNKFIISVERINDPKIYKLLKKHNGIIIVDGYDILEL